MARLPMLAACLNVPLDTAAPGGVSGDPSPTRQISCDLPRDFLYEEGGGRDGIPSLVNPDLVPANASGAGYLKEYVGDGVAPSKPPRAKSHRPADRWRATRRSAQHPPVASGTGRSAQADEPRTTSGRATLRVEETRVLDVETGSEWTVEGRAVAGSREGERLIAVPDAFVAFWLAWVSFYPETRIWTP